MRELCYLWSKYSGSLHVQQFREHVNIGTLLELQLLVQRREQNEDRSLDTTEPNRRSMLLLFSFILVAYDQRKDYYYLSITTIGPFW